MVNHKTDEFNNATNECKFYYGKQIIWKYNKHKHLPTFASKRVLMFIFQDRIVIFQLYEGRPRKSETFAFTQSFFEIEQ